MAIYEEMRAQLQELVDLVQQDDPVENQDLAE